MYNGIGLQTARGSGTNGYVQTNKFFIKPKTTKVVMDNKGFGPDQGTAGIAKKPNKDILEHDRKRQIELKLTILEDKLIDQGYTDAEIMEKLKETRTALEAADAASSEDGGNAMVTTERNVSDTQTHQIAARKEKQLETLRAALGISLPEAKTEEQQGISDMDVHASDDEKSKNYRKGGSEGDVEYEEGEILHRNDDREARSGRQIEDVVDKRKFDKGRRYVKNEKGQEAGYKHKKQGRSRKHDEEMRRVYSSTDTESDGMHSTDSEHDSAMDTTRKRRSQRKSKKSMSDSGDSSASDSDDSGGAYGRRGQKKWTHKHKRHSKRGNQGRKVRYSASSDFDTERKMSSESDSDVEIKRKKRNEKSKKSKSETNDDSDYSSDDSERVQRRRGSDEFVKARKRYDSDSDSDVEIKAKQRTEKSKKIKSDINHDSDYHSDDSEREYQRRGSGKFEKAHKRQASDRDSDLDTSRKDRYERAKRVKSEINDDFVRHSDGLGGEYERRRSEVFVKAHKRHDSDSDSDDNDRSTSHKTQKVGWPLKRGRHDSEDDASDDEEHKDKIRGNNNDDDHRRERAVADNRDYKRHKGDVRENDDREHAHDVTGRQRDDFEYRKKYDRVVDEQNEREHGQKGLGDDRSGDQRRDEKEYRRKHEDKHDYRRHRRDEEYGSKGRGRREEDHHESRRHDRDRDSSKRARYEDSRLNEHRHRDRDHFDEDRWR